MLELHAHAHPPFAPAPLRCGMLSRSRRTSYYNSLKRRSNDAKQAAIASSQRVTSLVQIVPKVSLGRLALAGATLGPLLDGIHGTVHLLEYKVGLAASTACVATCLIDRAGPIIIKCSFHCKRLFIPQDRKSPRCLEADHIDQVATAAL